MPCRPDGPVLQGLQVHIQVTQNKEYFTVLQRVVLITGVLKVEVTNVSSGKTLELNVWTGHVQRGRPHGRRTRNVAALRRGRSDAGPQIGHAPVLA